MLRVRSEALAKKANGFGEAPNFGKKKMLDDRVGR
jgi:hypothetical protein